MNALEMKTIQNTAQATATERMEREIDTQRPKTKAEKREEFKKTLRDLGDLCVFIVVVGILIGFIVDVILFAIPSIAHAETLSELAEAKHQAMTAYEQKVAEQEAVQVRIVELQVEVDAATAAYEKKRDELGHTLKTNYKTKVDPLDVFIASLLSNTPWSGVLQNMDYYDKVMEEQNRIVTETKTEKDALDARMGELESAKAEADALVIEAEEICRQAEEAYEALKAQIIEQMRESGYTGDFPDGWLTVEQMMFTGAVDANGFHYTYYSEKVLPGGGLRIPGRHHEDCGCVCDENGYVVVANDVLKHGVLVPTPLVCHPVGCVWDCGVGRIDGCDIYMWK